jgi:hypothetical protein
VHRGRVGGSNLLAINTTYLLGMHDKNKIKFNYNERTTT